MDAIDYQEWEGHERRRGEDREFEREVTGKIHELRERILTLEMGIKNLEERIDGDEELIESNAKAIKERKPFKELAGDFLYKVICGAFVMAAIAAASKFFSGIIDKLTK